jgi:ferrous iron transport protein B
MTEGSMRYIVLAGNPNTGKSTLFNRLTGLRQKTSNLPGTTVERRAGSWNLSGKRCHLVDLPGSYSLFPSSADEAEVAMVLASESQTPDLIVYVADATNLRRHLLMFAEMAELGIPMVLALSMMDMAALKGLDISIEALSLNLGVLVVPVNPRTGEGIANLEAAAAKTTSSWASTADAISPEQAMAKLRNYLAGHELIQPEQRKADTVRRFAFIGKIVDAVITRNAPAKRSATRSLDRLFTHRIWGFVLLFFILYLIFQSVFYLAEAPMGWIEDGMAALGNYLSEQMPKGFFNGLVSGGIIPGLSGVLVFIPQIALLFLFLSILEDSGYMPRASFITDQLMRKAGLNGRSVIPLVGGMACAIPSIMAARTIPNVKDRLITIFVTPLMSCSARLPVYVLLISLAVPEDLSIGIFDARGLLLTAIYLLGAITAIVVAFLASLFIRQRGNSGFIMELPDYQWPRLANILQGMYQRCKAFVWQAGSIILIISVVLWLLASFGPGNAMEQAALKAEAHAIRSGMNAGTTNQYKAAAKLEHSYAGILGKSIEPAIAPLGFDWKTGIALITSFAAREVFVGTMSTIYAVGNEEQQTIKEKMAGEINPASGKPRYGVPFALSLLVFYAFALQCMSTLAVVRRETGSWKWPMIQLLTMTLLAYGASFITFRMANIFF